MNISTQRTRAVTFTITELQRRMLVTLVERALAVVRAYPDLNDSQLAYIADLEATALALRSQNQVGESER